MPLAMAVCFFACRSVYRSPTHPCHDHAAYIRARSLLAHYFFLAHYACRSSHQILGNGGNGMRWGGGSSHSCTCVCTRTYTRVYPFDGPRKLQVKWARRERMCTVSLSLLAPASRILCSLCVHVRFACLSLRARVCLYNRERMRGGACVCPCTLSGPIQY